MASWRMPSCHPSGGGQVSTLGSLLAASCINVSSSPLFATYRYKDIVVNPRDSATRCIVTAASPSAIEIADADGLAADLAPGAAPAVASPPSPRRSPPPVGC